MDFSLLTISRPSLPTELGTVDTSPASALVESRSGRARNSQEQSGKGRRVYQQRRARQRVAPTIYGRAISGQTAVDTATDEGEETPRTMTA